jgi:triphosphoribosyl-dephospho-CoA synthase
MSPRLFSLDMDQVSAAFRTSCRLDVVAVKPGNVSVAAPGHGMKAQDFIASAEAAAPAMCAPGICVGARILRAIEATRRVVSCNTNLGIVLLSAPLAQAALASSAVRNLRGRLHTVLTALTVRDAEHAYRAIRLASPGGLGRAERHDVAAEPEVTLLEAMREAAGRDRIANQYASGFEDVFEVGLPAAHAALAGGANPERAVVEIYLVFLARFPDSHIMRKCGEAVAQAVCLEAASWRDQLIGARGTGRGEALLANIDGRLKSRGINPGTSADLTVATWFAVVLEESLQAEYHSSWVAPAADHR